MKRQFEIGGQLLLAVALLWSLDVRGQDREMEGEPWSEMNYGNFTTLSLEVSPGNIAYKGIAIRLDKGDGGVSAGNEFMVFDTDTLRYAGGWVGDDFIDWRAIGLNGEHEIHPSVIGDVIFSNPVGPGWGRPDDGHFEDERVLGRDGLRYGPLARDWAHWKGLYVYGDRVILQYTVGGTQILESPSAEGGHGQRALSRTINFAPHSEELIIQIMHQPDTRPELRVFNNPDSPNKVVALFEGNASKPRPRQGRHRERSRENGSTRVIRENESIRKTTAVAMVGGQEGMEWIATDYGDLRLRIPASGQAASLKLLYGNIDAMTAIGPFTEIVRASKMPSNLESLTHGGEERWPEELVTQGTLGVEEGAYVVDTISAPMDNPWDSWLRFGGFDFFGDDSKAALGTWNGDVWIVSGIGDSLDNLVWKRFATGLFQPLGVKILNDDIYVLGRDQITVLRDLNGNGEADFYENFNNDAQVTEHFHEFALDLQLGIDGNFYYNKGGRHAADSVVPHHGTMLRVARDGSSTEIVARGFRAPNGLGIGPQGEFMTSDNEGHWTPANRLNWVEPGLGEDTQFYGYRMGYIEGLNIEGYTPPLCWLPPAVDRSPGTFIWVPDRRWGPLRDRIISISYGMGQMFHVMHEEVEGVVQGGAVRFPLDFDTGVCRVKFRKRDGQLYTCGLFGWSGNKTGWGGFYRVRYTGKDLYMPEELHIAQDGLSLTFTDPLDPQSATDVGNYGIKHWNYEYREEYGSGQFKMDGSEGQDTLQVEQAAVSGDKRTVYLKIPGIREVMQMEIQLSLKAADGETVRHVIYNTINKMGTKTLNEMMGDTQIFSRKMEEKTGTEGKVAGLAQTIWAVPSDGDGEFSEDTRVSRMPALYINEGEPPSPFVPAGRFESTWEVTEPFGSFSKTDHVAAF